MSDYIILNADRLVTPPTLKFEHISVPFGERTSNQPSNGQPGSMAIDMVQEFEFVYPDEEEVFGQKTECRICHEEDFIVKMEAPCACKGTIQFAHRKCLQKCCMAKENVTCEICHKAYQPVYSAPPPSAPPQYRRPRIDIRNAIGSRPRMPVHSSPPLLRQVRAEHRLVDDCDNDENVNAASSTWCNAMVIAQTILCCCNALLLTLLLFKDVFISSQGGYDSSSTMFYLTLCLLIPSYITSFVASYCQSRGQKPEAYDSMDTAEVAIVIETENQDENAADDQEAQELSEPEDSPLLT